MKSSSGSIQGVRIKKFRNPMLKNLGKRKEGPTHTLKLPYIGKPRGDFKHTKIQIYSYVYLKQ